MQKYGWYFLLVGTFGLVTAVARAKNEKEFFLVLATVPTAFLVIRGLEYLRIRNRK